MKLTGFKALSVIVIVTSIEYYWGVIPVIVNYEETFSIVWHSGWQRKMFFV